MRSDKVSNWGKSKLEEKVSLNKCPLHGILPLKMNVTRPATAGDSD